MQKVPTEIYTRVVGYFRPTSCTNKGKREEIENRSLYNVKKIPAAVEKELTYNFE